MRIHGRRGDTDHWQVVARARSLQQAQRRARKLVDNGIISEACVVLQGRVVSALPPPPEQPPQPPK